VQNSFLYFGMTFSKITLGYGSFLIIWGLLVSVATGSSSVTSWIPSLIGIPLVAMGVLTQTYPSKAKLFSHIALVFGLIAFFGGLDFFRAFTSGSIMQNPAADISKAMLAATGLWYLIVGVKSFRWARQNKETI
jgi:hypothetical protein